MFKNEVFKKIRKKRKYSLEYLAKQLEKNYKTVWNWEKGATIPTKTDIIAISLILGVPLNEISDYEPVKDVNFAKQKNIDDYLSDLNDIIAKYGDVPGIYIDSIINLKKTIIKQKAENVRLLKNNSRYENLFNSIADIIYIKSKDFKVRKINDAFANYVGRTREFILGYHFTDFYKMNEIKELLRIEQDVFRTGNHVIDREITLPGYNGKRKGLFSVIPIYENGKVIEIVCTIKDITERKELVNKLELLKQVIDSSFEYKWIGIEEEGKFKYLYFSNSLSSIYGLDKDDLINDTMLWFKMIVDEDKSKAQQYFENKQMPKTVLYRIRTKCGKIKWLSDTTEKKDDIVFGTVREINIDRYKRIIKFVESKEL